MHSAAPIRIGIIGDYSARNTSHAATDVALGHAALSLGVEIKVIWLPTDGINPNPATLASFDGLLCAPGSPYVCMPGALAAIRHARENDQVFLGTCGGFQHMILEFARNVLQHADAEHEETAPGASRLFIHRLSCSLVGKSDRVRIRSGAKLSSIYGNEESSEQFWCNFGVNREVVDELIRGGLSVSATDADGNVRAVELPRHRFFLGTLFIPQLSSMPAKPHPVLLAFLAAASERDRRNNPINVNH